MHKLVQRPKIQTDPDLIEDVLQPCVERLAIPRRRQRGPDSAQVLLHLPCWRRGTFRLCRHTDRLRDQRLTAAGRRAKPRHKAGSGQAGRLLSCLDHIDLADGLIKRLFDLHADLGGNTADASPGTSGASGALPEGTIGRCVVLPVPLSRSLPGGVALGNGQCLDLGSGQRTGQLFRYCLRSLLVRAVAAGRWHDHCRRLSGAGPAVVRSTDGERGS